jgi:hypothetical protein
MASSYLVVHVADASVPSCSRATSGTCYYVELHFNGQRARTATKENPVWNQTFRFHTRDEQQAQGDDDDPSGGGLNLKAYVYSIDETSNSESLLGKTVVDQKGFDSHSSKAGLFPYDLLKSCSSDTTSAGPPPPLVVNGKLTLKVFHSAADDKALFDIEDANLVYQMTVCGVDNVKEIYTFLFESKEDHGEYGEAAAAAAADSDSIRNDDAVPRQIHPSLERGKVVERMQFLYVLVVKARDLPDVDAYGGLDPFVEVSFGMEAERLICVSKRHKTPLVQTKHKTSTEPFCVSLRAVFLLFRVVIPMMTLRLSPGCARWLPFNRSFIFFALLPYGFTLVGDSMLRRALNHDGMNKLSQLSVFVSFTLWATCLGSVLVYVIQRFHTVNQECLLRLA